MGKRPKPPTAAELNQRNKQFWEVRNQALQGDLENSSLMKVVNHEVSEQARKIATTAPADSLRVVLHHADDFQVMVDAEKKRISIRNSAHAENPRPKRKDTIRSLLIAAMKISKAQGNGLQDFLDSFQDHSTGGLSIQRMRSGKTDEVTISVDRSPEDLTKEQERFDNPDGKPSITRSFKTVEDYWTKASSK